MKRLTKIFQALLGAVALIFTTVIAMGRLVWRTLCSWWQGRSKGFRRLLAAISTIAVVGFVACEICDECDDGGYLWDENLSNTISVHYFQDDRCRVYNDETKSYTTPKLNWIYKSDKEHLAVYAIPNKRGFIDINTGLIAIDAKRNNYEKAWVFSEGVAAVVKDDMIGFINTQNETVIPFKFEYTSECRRRELSYVFHNGLCAMTNEDGCVGLIDMEGNWVVEPLYDYIWVPQDGGYRVCVCDGMHGVIDHNGAVVYPMEYNHIDIVEEGFVLTKDGRMWQVDLDGNITIPFMVEWSTYLYYPGGYDEDGNIVRELSDYMEYQVFNNYGIMNRITGKPITPAIYRDVCMLSKGLFEVLSAETYDYYMLDINGNVVQMD